MTVLSFTMLCPAEASAAPQMMNPSGMYLNEALCISGYGQYLHSRNEWVKFIDNFSRSGYYALTPYSMSAFAASPRGDMWQFDTPEHTEMITAYGGNTTDGSMNCTGFVWHAISHSLSLSSGIPISDTCEWVPTLNGFNDQGFSRNSWTGGGNRWYDFIKKYRVHYYEFETKAEMLSSGVLKKGDIIWAVDSSAGRMMNGFAIPAENHHIGIYCGNGSVDLWWQSGPTIGDGVMQQGYAYNSVNPIYGCAKENTFIVLPWSGDEKSHPSITEPVPRNADGRYFNEAMYFASGELFTETAEDWQDFIDTYSQNDYYNSTPYTYWLFASSPKGDKWQLDTEYAQMITENGGSAEDGGMNCMGFVWHALSNALSIDSGLPIAVTGQWVPLNSGFNAYFPDRMCWNAGKGWTNFISYYNIIYYEFDTKEEMLASGILRKGDIIWTVDGKVGTGFSGLLTLADDHHIGIYAGNGKSDLWWQAGPTAGDGRYDSAITSVNPIYGCATENTYVVIPFSSDRSSDTVQPVTTTAAVTVSATATVTTAVTSETASTTADTSPASATDTVTSASPVTTTDITAGTTAVQTAESDAVKVTTKAVKTNETVTYSIGDLDGNGKVDSADSSMILEAYALLSIGEESGLNEEQMQYADVTRDGAVNSADASLILEYYSYLSVGGKMSPIEYFAPEDIQTSDEEGEEKQSDK